jgi:hypothetical protein
MNVSRRGFQALALSLLAGRSPAQAPAPRSYVIASFVGDKIEFVAAGMQTGTRLDPNARLAMEDRGGAMDKAVLAAVADGVAAADAAAPVALALVPPSRLHDDPERMLQPDGVALPGPVVDLIERSKATHVVLVTKLRDDARFQLKHETIGRGKLRGLGFYLDESQRLYDVDGSRDEGRGFFAPYAYLRLSLVAVATAKVVLEARVTASEVVPIYASKTAATPWEALGHEEKARHLVALIRSHVRPAAQALVAPR